MHAMCAPCLIDGLTELRDQLLGAFRTEGRLAHPRRRTLEGEIGARFLRQVFLELDRSLLRTLTANEAALDLDTAPIRDRIDARAAFDASHAQRRRSKKLIAGGAAQMLGILFDAGQQA